MSYRRMLFATDFSDASRHALLCAAELARQLGSRIELVHVLALHDSDPAAASDLLLSAVPHEVTDVVEARRVVRAPRPELGILEVARDGGFDLLVLGTHGRTGLKHILLGSVAERVVQLAGCPVLTVRQPGQDFEHPGAAST